MSSVELLRLLDVLDDRQSSLGRDDIAWAVESTKTSSSITNWVQEYLSPSTLLSHEERFFNDSQAVKGLPGEEAAPELSDESLELAISTLEASTASIEKQCRLLDVQKRAIEDIVRRNASASSYSNRNVQRSGEATHQRSQLEFEATELSASLHTRLQLSLKRGGATISNQPLSIDRMLEKDDRSLNGLEKVLPQLSTSDAVTETSQEVDRLCHALSAQSSSDIHTQIDTVYRSAVQQHEGYTNGNHAGDSLQEAQHQQRALRSELDELCREIDGLSTMAVDSQYRIPVGRALHEAQEDAAIDRASWSGYLESTLRYLTARLDAVNDHFQHLHAHDSAIKTVSAALEIVAGKDRDKKPLLRGSPSKHSERGLKPLRLVQANLSESQDPVAQLLGQLDLRVPKADDRAKLADALSAAAKERHEKLLSLSTSSEHGAASQIALSLAKAGADVRAVSEAVFAPSEFGRVTLLNRQLQEGVDHLEEQTQQIGDQMRALDMNSLMNAVNAKRQAVLKTPRE